MLLKFALAGAYASHQGTYLPEKHLGPEYGGEHEDEQHPEQIRGEGHQIGRGRRQLQESDHDSGQAGDQQVGHDSHVLFQTVDRISGKKALAPVPAAAHHLRESVHAQAVAGFDLTVGIPPVHEQHHAQLQHKHSRKQPYTGSQRIVRHLRGYVHEMLARPDKGKGHCDPHCSQEHADKHPPPDRDGHSPECLRTSAERPFHYSTTPSFCQISSSLTTSSEARASSTS